MIFDWNSYSIIWSVFGLKAQNILAQWQSPNEATPWEKESIK